MTRGGSLLIWLAPALATAVSVCVFCLVLVITVASVPKNKRNVLYFEQ